MRKGSRRRRSIYLQRQTMDCKKSNKIREIVRLQQILKKWRNLANASNRCTTSSSSGGGGGGSKSIKFLKRTLSVRETSSNAVPKGYLAVCVGEGQRRFTIPTEYLGHPAFHALLREAEEEFGFQQTGILRIPCEVPVFESILKLVEEKKDMFLVQECRFDIDDGTGCCSSTTQQTPSQYPQSPMCR